MAPNRMPRRRQQSRQIDKVLSEGVYTTTDPMGKVNVLRQYQAAGLIPTRFNSPNEVSDAVAEALATGKTKEQALKSLKIELPLAFFDKKGSLIGRKFRDAQSPALIEAWNKGTKGLSAQDLAKAERREWGNAQEVLREVGRRLGMKLDIGHFETSASGAPGNVAAAGGENAKANQAAGSSEENPFRPQTQYETENVGFATNKVQGLGEAGLLTQDLPTRGGLVGMPLNPYVSVLLGTNLNGNSSRLLPKTNLEQFNYAFEQLVRQKANPVAMFDYVMERAGQGIDINEMAKAGHNQYDVSRFAPGIEAPNAGPVRQIQPPTPKGPTVTTKGVPKGLMPTEVVRNPSVALGQRAASIVNREPLPQPKPQPLPQPKPQPQPQAKPQPQIAPKPQPQPQAKPQPKVRIGTGRWAAAAASRPPSSSASAGRRSLTIGQNPLSPLNRGSAASGAIERSTNDAIQDAPGWSPFWLKLAD